MAPTVVLGLVLAAAPAHAKGVAVPYASLGLGIGTLSGSRVIVTQVPGSRDLPVEPGSSGCCPETGFGLEIRLGVKLFDAFAIEGGVLGQGWDLGGNIGGTGFAGGGARIYLLGLIETITDPLELPVELSFGGFFGYTLVGKDFAYEGTFAGFDATLDFEVADFLNIGARANFITPSYNPFTYTDYNKAIGRCLDSGGNQVNAPAVHQKGDETCSGSGPSASFFAPQVVFTFNIDVF